MGDCGIVLGVGRLVTAAVFGAFASPILFSMGVLALMPAMDAPMRGTQPEFGNFWPSLHAALIFLSFGAFGLGSAAALMFLTQEHDLKFHKLRAILSLLPPIQRLEKVASNIVLIGFVLLTAGLAIYPQLMHEKYGVYYRNDPMIVWSVFVWLVYVALLFMRLRGNGGRRFAWGALGSFVFILLTFWGVILLSPVHKS